ncbi:MAG: response regulator [Candidatus Omnitrophica bacterium]|nr:response regulator [Candidatus Omnitrophota bacterium]
MKPAILFVDDDVNNLHSLKRLFYDLREEWSLFFAQSADEALKILNHTDIQTIVTDMRMPQTDGAELLNIVRLKFPNIIRIILSGYADQSMITRTIASADQFFSKPYDIKLLKKYLETVQSAVYNLRYENIFNLGPRTSPVYILPHVYKNIISELSSTPASLKNIFLLAEQDPCLILKILNLVNSDFYGRRKSCTDHEQAVKDIGLEIFNELFFKQSIFQPFPDSWSENDLILETYKHAALHGYIARELSTQIFKSTPDSNTVFAITMLLYLSVIQLVLSNPKILNELKSNASFMDSNFCLNEYFRNINHIYLNQISTYLCQFAGLPNVISNTLRSFIYPKEIESETEQQKLLLKIIHFSGNLSDELLPYKKWNKIFNFSDIKFRPEEISQSELNTICERIQTNIHRI